MTPGINPSPRETRPYRTQPSPTRSSRRVPSGSGSPVLRLTVTATAPLSGTISVWSAATGSSAVSSTWLIVNQLHSGDPKIISVNPKGKGHGCDIGTYWKMPCQFVSATRQRRYGTASPRNSRDCPAKGCASGVASSSRPETPPTNGGSSDNDGSAPPAQFRLSTSRHRSSGTPAKNSAGQAARRSSVSTASDRVGCAVTPTARPSRPGMPGAPAGITRSIHRKTNWPAVISTADGARAVSASENTTPSVGILGSMASSVSVSSSSINQRSAPPGSTTASPLDVATTSQLSASGSRNVISIATDTGVGAVLSNHSTTRAK